MARHFLFRSVLQGSPAYGDATDMPHPFFECTLVGRRIALPTALEPFIGAYIVCYAGAVNHEQAITVTAAHLPKIGFVFEGVEGEVRQLNPTQ